jgi:hypothetical protein
MRSILGPDNPRIQQWKDVSADTKVSHESRLLAFGIFKVMWELDANHLPVPDGNKATRDLNTYPLLYSWIQMITLRSSLIQALFCVGGLAYNLLGETRELMCYTELQYKKSTVKHRAHPIVTQTDRSHASLSSAWTASATTSQDLRDKR